MKSIYILVGLLPVLSVAVPPPDPTCICPIVRCGGTPRQICECQNNAERDCFERCGGEPPVLEICPTDPPEPINQSCGSFNLPPCPYGQTCINNPFKPGCLIAADCPGICVNLEGPSCAGFTGKKCPDGLECVDKPNDECDPDFGGSDCPGICVKINKPQTCGGLIGSPCPDGKVCKDNPDDDCDPKKGVADCPGICVAE